MCKQRKDMKKRIIRALYSYPKHKEMLELTKVYLQFYNDLNAFIEMYMQTSRDMLINVSLVHSIDSALSTLPPEVNRYADKKYFKSNYYTVDGLAMEMSVDRRTLSRWDNALTTTVESYFNAMSK